jgi:hypothetical protein
MQVQREMFIREMRHREKISSTRLMHQKELDQKLLRIAQLEAREHERENVEWEVKHASFMSNLSSGLSYPTSYNEY